MDAKSIVINSTVNNFGSLSQLAFNPSITFLLPLLQVKTQPKKPNLQPLSVSQVPRQISSREETENNKALILLFLFRKDTFEENREEEIKSPSKVAINLCLAQWSLFIIIIIFYA